MAVTPEDVVNKRFTIVKFREGYDQDEVDDFLDEITKELRQMALENESLRGKLAATEALGNEPAPIMAGFPVAPIPSVADASSQSLLELARRLHEEHVREGLTKRDQLIRDGQENAARLVRDAESQGRAIIGQFELDRRAVESTIDELRDFEQDYRIKLRDYIEAQLASLVREEFIDKDPVQAGALAQDKIDLTARADKENGTDPENVGSLDDQNKLGERS